MPVYNAKSIPAEVHSSTKDPEVAAFLKTGPSRITMLRNWRRTATISRMCTTRTCRTRLFK
jgi:hypothetical protein